MTSAVMLPARTNELLAEYLVSMHVALGNDTDSPVDGDVSRLRQLLGEIEDVWLSARNQEGVGEQIMLTLDALQDELEVVQSHDVRFLTIAQAATNARMKLLQARVVLNRMHGHLHVAQAVLRNGSAVAA